MQYKQRDSRICSIVIILVMALIFGGMFYKIEAEAASMTATLHGNDSGTVGETFNFAVNPRTYNIDNIISFGYNWYFNNKHHSYSTIANCNYKFNSAGVFSVYVHVTCYYEDNNGNEASITAKSNTVTINITQPVTSISLSGGKSEIWSGNTFTLTATVLPDNATNKSISWSSSNTTVATVSSGKVTGKSAGSATIKATANDGSGVSKSYKVTVKGLPDVYDSNSQTNYNLQCGQTLRIITNCNYDLARVWSIDGDPVEYGATSDIFAKAPVFEDTANNPYKIINVTGACGACANCNNKGITTNNIGKTATLTATVSKTINSVTKTDSITYTITMVETPVESVTITTNKDIIHVGETLALQGGIVPNNATNPTITWSMTSGNSIGKLNSTTGNAVELTGLKEGSVTVKAATANGKFTTKIITVKPLIIKADKDWIWVGEELKLESFVEYNGTYPTGTWNTNNANIATIDTVFGSSTLVTGKSSGLVNISFTRNGVTIIKQITVKQQVTGIEITGPTACWVGRTAELTATCKPDNANNKSVTWRSSDESIATVNQNGVVTGISADSDGASTVTIRATAKDGFGTYKDYEFTVYQPVTSVELSIDRNGNYLYVGETIKLNVTLHPENAYNKAYEWIDDEYIDYETKPHNHITGISATGSAKTGKITIDTINTAPIIGEYLDDNGKYIRASIELNVYNRVTAVEISNNSIELFAGGSSFPDNESNLNNALSACAKPDPIHHLKEDRLIWTSQNTNLVTIKEAQDSGTNSNAKITLIPNGNGQLGKTTVTATSMENSMATASCSVELVEFKLNLSQMESFVGGECELIALKTTALDNVGTEYNDVKWSITSGNDVVEISETEGGRTIVKALKVGTATIQATATGYNTVTANCTVTVKNFDLASDVDNIFAPRDGANNPESTTLRATYNGKPLLVNWEIVKGGEYATLSKRENSDTTVITATSTGGKTYQDVTVRATSVSADGNGSMDIVVRIKQPIDEISFEKNEINMFIGTTYTFNENFDIGSIKPSEPHNKKWNWNVDNNNVVLTTNTANDGHSVTITAKDNPVNGANLVASAADGRGASATVKLNVRKLLLNDSNIVLYLGNKTTLQAFYTLSTVGARKPQNVEWKIESGENLISLSTTSGSSTIISTNSEQKTGVAFISATATEDTTATVECMVVVKALDILTDKDFIYVKNDKTPANKYQMQAIAQIENESLDVQWSSADTSIATIDSQTGLITGVGTKGKESATVRIKATLPDGSSTTKIIEVRQQATGVNICGNNKPITELVLYHGTTVELTGKISPEYAYDKILNWTVSNSNVTLSKTTSNSDEVITITGNKTGTSKIQLRANDGIGTNIIAECAVTVKKVSLSHETLVLYAGGTATLNAYSTVNTLANQEVKWTVQNANVVSLDSTFGHQVILRGLKQGSTIVTATTTDGLKNVSISCEIQVKTIDIIADKTTIYVENSSTDVSDYTAILKASASGKIVPCTWTLSNTDVAKLEVSESGMVSVVGLDSQTPITTVVVTAVCDDKNSTISGTNSITLTIVQQPYSVEVDRTSLILYKGTTYDVSAVLSPEYANNKNVIWTVESGKNVISVTGNNTTAKITALTGGTASVKVEPEDNKGIEPKIINVVVKDLTLSEEKITLFVGRTKTLTAKINGFESSVNWESDNNSIVTLDKSEGSSVTLFGNSKGTTKVYATTFDGDKNITKSVEVIVKSVVVEAPYDTLYTGETISLTAKIDDIEEPVYWFSGNESIATVTSEKTAVATVTGVAPGEISIYASPIRTFDRNNSVMIKIKVLQAVESMTISSNNITMYVGATYPLTITPNPANTTTTDFSWNIANGSVASFHITDSEWTKNLKATKVGSTTFEIVANDKNKAKVSGAITVKNLIIPNEILIYTGDSYTLTAMNQNNEAQSVKWAISGNSATIDKTVGSTIVISGNKHGEATLSATTTDATANITLTCKIRVVEIDLTAEKNEIYIGETSQLTAVIKGAEATCNWTSSDNTIASVNKNGLVTGVGKGKATITATSVDGITASVDITVKKAVSNVSLNKNQILIYGNGSYNGLVAITLPLDANDLAVNVISQLTSASMKIDSNKTYITLSPKSVGKETIIVSAHDGKGAKDTCEVYVKSLHLDKSVLNLRVNETAELTAWTNCVTKEEVVGNWKISDSSIASLTVNNGTGAIIKGIAPGETTVTVETTDGDVNASVSCKVIVVQPVETISLNKTELTLAKNRSEQLSVSKILPNNATDKTVRWSSSNKAIVDFVSEGSSAIILAKEIGNATITVTANDGSGVTATCNINVIPNNPENLVMYKGATMTVEIDPFSGLDVRETTWECDDSTIIKVQNETAKSAEFVALDVGTVEVLATSINGGWYAETIFTIEVKDLNVPPTITMYKGTKWTLSIDSAIKAWETNDHSVVSISATQAKEVVLTANKVGTAVVTVTTMDADANISKECVVTVKDLVLSSNSQSLKIGDKFSLTAMNGETTISVKWSIDNDCVVANTLTGSNLEITAKKPGTATITATTTDGVVNISKTCKVSVIQPVTKIVMKSSLTAYVGERTTLTVTYVPTNATTQKVNWSGYDESMISVEGNTSAIITGLKCGETMLVAEAADGNGATASCKITVKERVSKIELPSEYVMYVGNSKTLDYTVLPETASDKSVTWTSSNTSVATVNASSGLIKALKAGETTITCKAIDGSNISASCKLTVKQFVDQIILKNPTMDIYTNYEDDIHTAKIEIEKILPEGIGDVDLAWESSSPKYITVNQEGIITVMVSSLPNNLSYMDIEITCYALDGSGTFATCVVTLKQHASEVLLIDYEKFFVIEDGVIVALTDYAYEKLASNNSITIEIPKTIRNESIIGIANNVFKDCLTLTQIIIPSTINEIGATAFKGCNNLKDIYVMKKFDEIRNMPWGATNALIHWLDVTIDASKPQDIIITTDNRYLVGWTESTTTLDIPENFYTESGAYYRVIGIGANAFESCKNLTKVTIPYTASSIDEYAFANCPNLESITISSSESELGNITIAKYAFYNSGLKTVDWGTNHITFVGTGAFKDCKNLTTISFTEKLEQLSTNVFDGCESLKTVYIDRYYLEVDGSPWGATNNTKIIWKTVTDKSKAINVYLSREHWSSIGFDENLTELSIPDYFNIDDGSGRLYHVVGIDLNAFAGCTNLKKVTIPNSVSEIKENAFLNCNNLKEVAIGSGISLIYSNSFAGCNNVETFNIDVLEYGLEGHQRRWGANLDSVINWRPYTPFTVTASNRHMVGYTGANNEEWKIPDFFVYDGVLYKVVGIGDDACNGSRYLVSISIPATVTNIGTKAFNGCNYYGWSKLTSINVAENNETYCSVDGVLFTKDLKTLVRYPLARKGEYSVPNSVTTIKSQAFGGCAELTSIALPEGLVSVEDAFNGASALTSLTFPSTVTSIHNRILYNDVNRPDKIANIYVSEDNKTYASIDGVLFTKDLKTLVVFPTGKKGEYTVPESVKTIGDYAFQTSQITSVIIPDNVTKIGNYAFWNSDVKYAVVSNNVTTLYGTFVSCTDLETIKLPNSLTYIGTQTFLDCVKLREINLPDTVTTIGHRAFTNCPKLTTVIIPASVTNLTETAFQKCDSLTNIWVKKNRGTLSGSPWSATNATVHWLDEPTDIVITAENRHLIYEEGSKTLVTDGYFRDENGFLFKVVEIADSAFAGCPIETVELGATIDTIASNAFHNCSALKTITIDRYKDEITGSPWGASNNTKVIWKNVTDTSQAIDIILTQEHWTAIGFNNNTTEFDIPEYFNTDDGSGALYHVVGIGNNAFANCIKLTTIKVPSGVETIASNVFSGCSALKTVYIDRYKDEITGSPWGANNNTKVVWKNITDKSQAIDIVLTQEHWTAIGFNNTITEFDVPEYFNTDDGSGALYHVVGIGDAAFKNCSNLTKIKIPNSVTSFGDYAFYGCRKLQTINITNSITNIGDSAFAYTALTGVVIPDSVIELGEMAFWYCQNLTDVKIGNGIEVLEAGVFSDCTSLRNVIFGTNVSEIRNHVFSGCSSLRTITIPAAINTIQSFAFAGCESLYEICIDKLPNSVSGYETQWGAPNATIHWRATVDFVVTQSNRYLVGYKGLANESLEIPAYFTDEQGISYKVVEIDSSAFSGCSKLVSVTIPETVTVVDTYAFSNCSKLNTIILNEGLTTLNDYAFYNCSNLTSITLPASLTTIQQTAFRNNSNLQEINVSANNKNYKSIDGVLFNKVGTTLIKCPEAKTNAYTVPNAVTVIGSYAFHNCTKLTEITLPSNLKTINSYAFYGCNNLTGITLPNTVTAINSNAFKNCSSLVNITLPNSVTTIYASTFYGCSNLTNITLPSNLKTINSSVFSGCSALKELIIPATVTSINSTAFSNMTALTDIWVCKNKGELNNAPWGATNATVHWLDEPTDIVITAENKHLIYHDDRNLEIPEYITDENGFLRKVVGIADGAFANSWYLGYVTFNSGLTTIGNNAFANCSSLNGVTFSNTITTIGDSAFRGCIINQLYLPSSLKTIGQYAFAENNSLTFVSMGGSLVSVADTAFSGNMYLRQIGIYQAEGSISGCPWGANFATVRWNL